jgi:uncharacterized protein YbjT (DUF2867 family)
MAARSCLVLGATGLVGGHLLEVLKQDPGYATIKALVRRPLPREVERVTSVLCDLERPETYREHVAVDDVFCCLGTTIKAAGSREAFRKVDHDYPLLVAREALAAGAGRFLIVTAVGADPRSGIFYNRVKGEIEEALSALRFPRGVRIVRPSMLLGERAASRPLEHLAGSVMRATRGLFAGPLLRYRAIDAADVARALWRAAREEGEAPAGTKVYEGEALFSLAA